ncbi:MAG TPA: glycoside hydrolase family 76 protein [Humisphaera sp.]
MKVVPTAAAFVIAILALARAATAAPAETPGPYGAAAREVTSHLQKTFYDPARGFYVKAANDRSPDYVWRQAAAVAALVGAARHDPTTYRPVLDRTFRGLDAFWDAKAAVPGYEPAPTRGNGHDKYYDDNAWLVITYCEAFEQTGDRAYLDRACEVAKFVLSGQDDQAGGGVWWHEKHKDGSKNACANGPAAVGYLRLARLVPEAEAAGWIGAARKATDWTKQKLQADDGLFDDRLIVATGEVKRGKLTYNSALMIRAYAGLYRAAGRADDLDEAKRIGKAADWFLDAKTGVYRDPLKWSHSQVEADLELYRLTGDAHLLERAKANADGYVAAWRKDPYPDMMSNASLARILWLLADTETEAGRKFWVEADKPRAER